MGVQAKRKVEEQVLAIVLFQGQLAVSKVPAFADYTIKSWSELFQN